MGLEKRISHFLKRGSNADASSSMKSRPSSLSVSTHSSTPTPVRSSSYTCYTLLASAAVETASRSNWESYSTRQRYRGLSQITKRIVWWCCQDSTQDKLYTAMNCLRAGSIWCYHRVVATLLLISYLHRSSVRHTMRICRTVGHNTQEIPNRNTKI